MVWTQSGVEGVTNLHHQRLAIQGDGVAGPELLALPGFLDSVDQDLPVDDGLLGFASAARKSTELQKPTEFDGTFPDEDNAWDDGTWFLHCADFECGCGRVHAICFFWKARPDAVLR